MEHSLSHALRHRALVHVNDGEEDRLLRFMELLTLFCLIFFLNSLKAFRHVSAFELRATSAAAVCKANFAISVILLLILL
jgi:hypothetical protein